MKESLLKGGATPNKTGKIGGIHYPKQSYLHYKD